MTAQEEEKNLEFVSIILLHNPYENGEKSKSLSTVVCTDFTKAFDRLDHNIIIRKLIKLNVRPCIIEWIISFLEHRQKCVKYQGNSNLNTGVPQGTKLGPILFLVMINDACENIPIDCYKYVDDLTLLECR